MNESRHGQNPARHRSRRTRCRVSTLDPSVDLRDELDIDSMDFLNILVRIEKDLGVSVPEQDYGEVSTLEALTRYVHAARAGTG
jgi:acyl carrier protein